MRKTRKQRGGAVYQTPPRSVSGSPNGYEWAAAEHGGYGEWKGGVLKQYNEDRFVVIPLGSSSLFALVLDGHGGSQVSDAVAIQLPKLVLQRQLTDEQLADAAFLQETLKELFIQMNIWVEQNIYSTERCGAAGTAVIVTPQHIVMANVGDSPAIVYDKATKELTSTVDHECTNPAEAQRLNAIYTSLSPRQRGVHGLPCIDTMRDEGIRLKGGLAMTRSFGDFGMRPYITGEPDTYVVQRKAGQRLLMSSDSFTEGITRNRAGTGNTIKNIMTREQVVEEVDPIINKEGSLVKKVEEAVTNRINKFWFPGHGYSGDNTTLLVVELPDPPVASSVASPVESVSNNYFGFNSPKPTQGGKYRRKSRRNIRRKHRITRRR